jgi:hypothetical protein
MRLRGALRWLLVSAIIVLIGSLGALVQLAGRRVIWRQF